jgi:hypothetical protein
MLFFFVLFLFSYEASAMNNQNPQLPTQPNTSNTSFAFAQASAPADKQPQKDNHPQISSTNAPHHFPVRSLYFDN